MPPVGPQPKSPTILLCMVSGLKAAYKVGSALRKVINSARGCNCGKK